MKWADALDGWYSWHQLFLTYPKAFLQWCRRCRVMQKLNLSLKRLIIITMKRSVSEKRKRGSEQQQKNVQQKQNKGVNQTQNFSFNDDLFLFLVISLLFFVAFFCIKNKKPRPSRRWGISMTTTTNFTINEWSECRQKFTYL